MRRVLVLAMLLSVSYSAVAQQKSGVMPERQRREAIQLEQEGKTAEAEAAWSAARQAFPQNPEPYAHLGLLKARQGNNKDAIALYRKSLALNPRVSAVRLDMGLALFKDGQLKDAAKEFAAVRKQLPADSPEISRLDVLLGLSYYGIASYADAVPFLKAASQRDPQNSPLLLTLAHSCLWSNQSQCVLDAYRQILSLNAESAEADMLAGEALDEAKDSTGAIKMFRAAVAANPKEPDVHFGLGYLLWTQKQYPEAVEQFKAELENDPRHAQSLVYLGDSYLQLNNPADARAPLEKGLALDPSLWIAELDLGIMDADAGRNEAALKEFKKALAIKPNEVNVHWRLGRLYRAMGRTDEAKAEIETAKKLNQTADDDLHQQIANGKLRSHTDTQSQQMAPVQ